MPYCFNCGRSFLEEVEKFCRACGAPTRDPTISRDEALAATPTSNATTGFTPPSRDSAGGSQEANARGFAGSPHDAHRSAAGLGTTTNFGAPTIRAETLRVRGETTALVIAFALFAASWLAFDISTGVVPVLVVTISLFCYILYSQGALKGF
jgi:hypothetical protein